MSVEIVSDASSASELSDSCIELNEDLGSDISKDRTDDEKSVLIPKLINDDNAISQSQYQSILSKKVEKSNKIVAIKTLNQHSQRNSIRCTLCTITFAVTLLVSTLTIGILTLAKPNIAWSSFITVTSILGASAIIILLVSGVGITYFALKHIATNPAKEKMYHN